MTEQNPDGRQMAKYRPPGGSRASGHDSVVSRPRQWVPQLTIEWNLTDGEQSWLTMSVQLGFVIGALVSAFLNLPDRGTSALSGRPPARFWAPWQMR